MEVSLAYNRKDRGGGEKREAREGRKEAQFLTQRSSSVVECLLESAYAQKVPTSELPLLRKAMSSPFPAASKQSLREP